MTIKRPRRVRAKISADEDAKLMDSALATIVAQDDAEALQNYLGRGRRFQGLDAESLKDQWTAAARRFFLSLGEEGSQEMSDAAAELGLREIDPPMHLVENELAIAREQLKHDKDDPEIRARIRARIRELRARQRKFH